MILINKTATNNVILTLNEMIEGTNPYDFLFEFINDTTGDSKLFTATDISQATERYNQFTIIESTTENVYNGTIELSPIGYWSYNIYQMNVTSPPDLNPLNAVALIETGKVYVQDLSVTPVPTFEVDDNKNNVVWDSPND